VSKPLEIGQECWVFFGETGSPALRKATVEKRTELQEADMSAPNGVSICIRYRVRYKSQCDFGSRVTADWSSLVYATKEEAIASLGGGE